MAWSPETRKYRIWLHLVPKSTDVLCVRVIHCRMMRTEESMQFVDKYSSISSLENVVSLRLRQLLTSARAVAEEPALQNGSTGPTSRVTVMTMVIVTKMMKSAGGFVVPAADRTTNVLICRGACGVRRYYQNCRDQGHHGNESQSINRMDPIVLCVVSLSLSLSFSVADPISVSVYTRPCWWTCYSAGKLSCDRPNPNLKGDYKTTRSTSGTLSLVVSLDSFVVECWCWNRVSLAATGTVVDLAPINTVPSHV